MESEEQKISKIFEVLSASGAIEWIGVDNKGEPVYRFTDICKEVFPELYAIHAAELSQTTNELWQMGVVDIIFGSQGNSVTFTEVNHQRYREVRDDLNEEQNNLLEVIVGVSLKTL